MGVADALVVLAIADTNPRLDLAAVADQHQADAIVALGDLAAPAVATAAAAGVPRIGVYGNHCTRGYLEDAGFVNLHLATLEIAGVVFGGLEGCVRYKADPGAVMYTQDEYSTMLADFPPVDVLITHCPPAGVNDHGDPAHLGIEALRNYLKRHRPAALLHGHTYPDPPETRFADTDVAYVHGAALVRIPRREDR